MTSIPKLREIIDKWKVNRGLLASKMEMPRGTFNNKLSPKHSTQFSDLEHNRLCQILIEIWRDLDEVEGADFGEALGILVKQKGV